MRVIEKRRDIHIEKKSILTIGNFDGVHKGHKVIIKKVVKEAKQHQAKAVVFTFVNHPAVFLKKIEPLFLMTKEEKIRYLRDLGVDEVVFLKFTLSLSKKKPVEFLNFLLKRITVMKIIVGHNFYFGRNNEGNVNFLRQFAEQGGYEFESVPLLKDKLSGENISSSVIRKFLLKGDIKQANRFLGYSYGLDSTVVKGKQLGRKIGFPTLNFSVSRIKKIIPKDGVYHTRTSIGEKQYRSFTYINQKASMFETFVLNFNKMIYGQTVRVEFLEFLRKPKRIKNLEKLKHQLILDVNSRRKS